MPFGLQMAHCCVHTELQDASFLIAGCQKELFVTAVPPRSIATFHCLGLSFNNVPRFLFCSQSDTSCRKRKGQQSLKISSSKENYLKEQELLYVVRPVISVFWFLKATTNHSPTSLCLPLSSIITVGLILYCKYFIFIIFKIHLMHYIRHCI